MFQNSWSLKFPQQPTHLTIAMLPSPSFVYQGKSNQLSVYQNNHIQTLPIRKQIVSLQTIQQSLILLLTKYSLTCYDLLNNQQKYNIQFENAQKLYIFNNKIYIISNSSLYCYNFDAQQIYVNHISSHITAITYINNFINPNQSQQIIICTDQMNMYRYNKLNIVFDYAKVIGNITSLCWISKGVMVGTDEGSIAYYQSKKYKWKAKSVHGVQNIIKFQQISSNNKNSQFVNKNADKIIVVRKDGNLQIRDWENGTTTSKIKLSENIIHSFSADFRNQGYNQIICCLESGTLTSLNIKDESQPSQKQSKQLKNQTTFEIHENDDKLQTLNKIKQQLLYNISQLKNNIQQNTKQQQNQIQGQILNSNFKIKAKLQYKNGLILIINSQHGYISGITFQQPIMPFQMQKTTCLHYKFHKDNKIFGDISCQVIAHSTLSNAKFQVKKFTINIPKFWKWGFDPSSTSHRSSSHGRLKFKLIERNARFLMWIKQCFLLAISQKQKQKLQQQSQIKFTFYNTYQQQYIQINFYQKQGEIQIYSNSIKIMGQIFQDLINFIGIKNINSQLLYPQQKQKIKQLINNIQKLLLAQQQQMINLTQFINTIKFLLIKCQYLRQLNQITQLKKTYIQIQQQNKNLILRIETKNKNQQILNQQLSQLNNFINSIANIRHGQPKNQVINRCRDAIKNKRFPDIYSIMDKGVDMQ